MKDGCRVIANPLGYEKKGERENAGADLGCEDGEVADG